MQALRLPGIPNIHSHAFQRAMAGLAERSSGERDSFWTWRELMYRFAGKLTPESMQDISAQLFVEMLEAGYTSVCEFHYLHHQPDGQAYADRAAMSRAIIAAARETGIRLTLLPVLYIRGGFDGRALSGRQRRFGHEVQDFLRLLETLAVEEDETLRLGLALHSLRAVPPEAMRELLAAKITSQRPIHIHVAEQTLEVEECLALRGARPVQWLLEHAEVGADWTLVHATHINDAEIAGIAASQAVVAICPTTEANLGDGLFPLRNFLDRGGRIGIGSDSNVSVSPVEELRWLEYGQRLSVRGRNVVADVQASSSGENLVQRTVAGGRQSNGQGRQEQDFILLDADAPALQGYTSADLHDRFVFAGNRNLVRETWVDGRRVVADGRHPQREAIALRYQAALAGLLAAD